MDGMDRATVVARNCAILTSTTRLPGTANTPKLPPECVTRGEAT